MSNEKEIAELKDRIGALERHINRLNDINAIRSLQYTYGYFMDKGLYDEVVDLFAEDGVLSFMGGFYKGKESVRRLYCGRLRTTFTKGQNNPIDGVLVDHMQSQGVIDITDDGLSAKARFRGFLQGGFHKSMQDAPARLPRQWWEAGVYENDYVKDNGVWKIKFLNYNLQWQGTFEEGWSNTDVISSNSPVTYPEDPLGPDELHAEPPRIWPQTYCVPFHYVHPVTGKPVKISN